VTAAGSNHFPTWILSLFEKPLPKDFRGAEIVALLIYFAYGQTL
jgi:hypothetical protein